MARRFSQRGGVAVIFFDDIQSGDYVSFTNLPPVFFVVIGKCRRWNYGGKETDVVMVWEGGKAVVYPFDLIVVRAKPALGTGHAQQAIAAPAPAPAPAKIKADMPVVSIYED